VFRDLQKALAIYGSASGGGVEEGDTPVQSKEALVEELRKAIADTLQFCTERGINFDEIKPPPKPLPVPSYGMMPSKPSS
jgi:type I restriction enzyme R subunit